MSITKSLQKIAIVSIIDLYHQVFTEKDFQVSTTKPEFEGNYTIVLFSLVKNLKKSPDTIGNELGESLVKNHPNLFSKYNVIKGFLNLTITDNYLFDLLNKNFNDVCFGKHEMNGKK